MKSASSQTDGWGLKEVELSAPVHLAFDELELADLPHRSDVGPRGGDRAPRRPPCPSRSRLAEGSNTLCFCAANPDVKVPQGLSVNDALEFPDDLARFDQNRDAALDRSHRQSLGLREPYATDGQQASDRAGRWGAGQPSGIDLLGGPPSRVPLADDASGGRDRPGECAPQTMARGPLLVEPLETGFQRTGPGAEDVRALTTQDLSDQPAASLLSSAAQVVVIVEVSRQTSARRDRPSRCRWISGSAACTRLPRRGRPDWRSPSDAIGRRPGPRAGAPAARQRRNRHPGRERRRRSAADPPTSAWLSPALDRAGVRSFCGVRGSQSECP